jgi:hypothetical protein
VQRVCKRRPAFPPGCPPAYVALAHACWAQDYHARPAFDHVIRELQGLLLALQLQEQPVQQQQQQQQQQPVQPTG